jgi:hypothetical protein
MYENNGESLILLAVICKRHLQNIVHFSKLSSQTMSVAYNILL